MFLPFFSLEPKNILRSLLIRFQRCSFFYKSKEYIQMLADFLLCYKAKQKWKRTINIILLIVQKLIYKQYCILKK